MVKTIFNGEYEKKPIIEGFVENLEEMLQVDSKVIYMDADLMFAYGNGMWDMADKYPDRMLRCGIAEANMVSAGTGMSMMGMKPIVHSFAAFVTRRAFDQIFISGAYNSVNLNIIGSEPGYKQTFNGGTHMAFEDIAMMRTVPDATIIDIVDGIQFNKLIRKTVNQNGIYYYRTPLADNIALYDKSTEFEIGKGNVIKEGVDATIIACGRLVTLSLQAALILEKEGISIRVVDMFTIKPLDEELILKCAKETSAIITAENHSIHGGLGSAVSEYLGENYPTIVERVGIRDEFGEVGPEDYLRTRYHFTPEDIVARVKAAIAKKKVYI